MGCAYQRKLGGAYRKCGRIRINNLQTYKVKVAKIRKGEGVYQKVKKWGRSFCKKKWACL